MAYFPVVALSSLIMGLLFTPVIYIAIGALSGFATAFTLASLPLLFVCTLFLLWRCTAPSAAGAASNQALLALESVAWLLVAFFLFVVSGFTLLNHEERIGLFCTLLLTASFVAAPWMALRPPILAARIAQWPSGLVLACSLIAPALLSMGSAIYLYKSEHFL